MSFGKDKQVTIVDIAGYLGISKTTVGYVLSGQAKKRGVAKKTASRVTKAAKELEYVPNHWARSLQGKRTQTVSTLFVSLELSWAHTIMQGIKSVLGPKGYSSIISMYDCDIFSGIGNYRARQREIASILERRDEGLICEPIPPSYQNYTALLNSHIPIVFIGSLLDDMTGLESISSVTWDCGPAAQAAVRHLIETGYKRIGFIGAKHGLESDHLRYRAYEEMMMQAGLQVNPEWVAWGAGYKKPPYEGIKRIFTSSGQKPDAFFVLNDALAITTIAKLQSIGVVVPDDIAIVGMGDLPISSALGLTTVCEPLREIGREAARVLLNLIENPENGPTRSRISCDELKIRKTAKSDLNLIASM